jgi:hypothetical protein
VTHGVQTIGCGLGCLLSGSGSRSLARGVGGSLGESALAAFSLVGRANSRSVIVMVVSILFVIGGGSLGLCLSLAAGGEE